MNHSAPRPPDPVRLTGEYDLSRQNELRDVLLAAADDVVVVDLTDVSFLDSTAVNVFVDVRNRLHADGRALRVINLNGMPKRVFDITGLTPLFSSEAS